MEGLIRARIQAAGGINDDGEPVEAMSSWGDPVPCKYFANTLNNRGTYQDGQFTISEYIITTKMMSFKADQIRLTDEKGLIICEKSVQSLEVLSTVRRVKITV